ncbi:aldo/keto reductase [bacterium]|nr:aldo/keto reductase [bacterium]
MPAANRRDFIRRGAAAGLGLASFGLSSRRIFGESTDFRRVVFRNLGSTGFQASEVGFGAMNMRDEALVMAAVDNGINYVDTAHSYMNGENEEIVGRALKSRRDRVFVSTKIKFDNSGTELRDMPGMIDLSLKRLQMDHLDLLMLHITDSREQILRNDLMKIFDTAKKQGKTRFVGISTHANQAEVLDAAVESKFWDAALVGYNYYSPPEVTAAIRRAREAGIAIIGMKILITTERPRKPFPDIRTEKMKGISNQQALLKWVLENPYVDTTIPGMTSFEQLEDDIAIMGMKLTFDDSRILERYGERTRERYCRGVSGCTGCREQCPKGVCVSDLNRCVNYADGYGDIGLAWENYRNLPASSRVDVCGDCGECMVKCVNGLDLTSKIERARILFG